MTWTKPISIAIISAALVLLGACGDETTADETQQLNTPVVETVLTKYSVSVLHWQTLLPLSGVTLCTNIAGTECTTTDKNGEASFTADMVHGATIQFWGDRSGFFPFLAEQVIPGHALDNLEYSPDGTALADAQFRMVDTSVIDNIVSALDTQVDESKGHISVTVLNAGWASAQDDQVLFIQGAKVTIAEMPEMTPKYLRFTDPTGNNHFGDEANGTTSDGLAAFFNVDVGTHHITVEADGYTCFLGGGQPSPSGTTAATTKAGRLTYVFVLCEANG